MSGTFNQYQRRRGTRNRGNHGRGTTRGHGHPHFQGIELRTHPEKSQETGSCRGGWRGISGNRGRGRASGRSVSSNTYKGYGGPQATGQTFPKPQQRFLDFAFIEHIETVRLLPQFRVMFILRGLPGSGKSTIADAILQKYAEHAIVCSADYYRYNKDGEYVWHQGTLQETHNKCQRRAEKFATLSKPIITVDNTNLTRVEMETYFNLANKYSYVVILVEPKTPWKFQARELAAKNTHAVPYSKICSKIGQFEEILPLYFGWFLPPKDCATLQKLAKDVLWKCLQVPDFQQSIMGFLGHLSSKITVHHALSYYTINYADCQNGYHVTACYSPRGKYLAGSPYHKSPTVEKAVGQISHLSVIGWVITSDTLSARVSLTKKQRALWLNDHESKRGSTRNNDSVEELTTSLHRLPFANNARSPERLDHCTHASTHITLGTGRGVNPVRAKYEVQSVVDYELSSCQFNEYTLKDDLGTLRKYSDTIWAVSYNSAHVYHVPAIFGGCY